MGSAYKFKSNSQVDVIGRCSSGPSWKILWWMYIRSNGRLKSQSARWSQLIYILLYYVREYRISSFFCRPYNLLTRDVKRLLNDCMNSNEGRHVFPTTHAVFTKTPDKGNRIFRWTYLIPVLFKHLPAESNERHPAGGGQLLFRISSAVQPSPVQHDIQNLPLIWRHTWRVYSLHSRLNDVFL